jgi:small subunit ribosomal protein S1
LLDRGHANDDLEATGIIGDPTYNGARARTRPMPSSDRPEESFAALFEQTGRAAPPARGPRPGDVFDVVVVQVGKDAVFVELDGRRQGYLEATDVRAPDGTIVVAPGARLRARVVEVGDEGVRLAPTVDAAVAVGASVSVGAASSGGGASEGEGVKVAVGQVVSGTVDRVENYGVFIQIDGTKGRAGRGLAPTAELGTPRGADLRKAFPLGTKLKAKIVAIEEGKMRLSLRALKDDEERADVESFRAKEKQNAGPQTLGTFGDLLKARKPK